nr:hypothetical protein OG999_46730 [Streptomyces sp. NBC_00886]
MGGDQLLDHGQADAAAAARAGAGAAPEVDLTIEHVVELGVTFAHEVLKAHVNAFGEVRRTDR